MHRQPTGRSNIARRASIITPAARHAIGVEVTERARRLFFTVALLALTGMLGIVATGDAFNLYVFLEISSLASYALIAMGNSRRATTAASSFGAVACPITTKSPGIRPI